LQAPAEAGGHHDRLRQIVAEIKARAAATEPALDTVCLALHVQ
jgi:hypothetical protein